VSFTIAEPEETNLSMLMAGKYLSMTTIPQQQKKVGFFFLVGAEAMRLG
jgi:hypothetical protein